MTRPSRTPVRDGELTVAVPAGRLLRAILRVDVLLREIGGPKVAWGAQNILEVWVAETRMESERRSAHRLILATWTLALITPALVLATVGLIVATINGKEQLPRRVEVSRCQWMTLVLRVAAPFRGRQTLSAA